MKTNKLITKATLDILPLGIAVIPWGILCGTISIDIGLNFWQAQALSMFVFAGAAQLSAMTLIGAGAGFLAISGSVFAISSRHILYSIDLRENVHQLPFKWKLSLAFFLTDEMYAVTKSYMQKHGKFSPLYSLTSGIVFYVLWNISTYIGIIMGKQIENLENLGLDFAIVAVFIAMTTSNLKQHSMIVTTLVSAICAIFFKEIFPDIYIIIASLFGMLAGYISSGESK